MDDVINSTRYRNVNLVSPEMLKMLASWQVSRYPGNETKPRK